ncbi:MAG: MBL fold metallo-hydrolase [Clostridia bacterium]|nr:MBL fold metallo-hydrolase [Clostridia bacterium]
MLKPNKKPWDGYVAPGRIFGNLYFVGSHPASTHLIDTGDGLILIDPGYIDTLYLVIQNMWELGFDPRDIKYIVVSHGHGDHMNGTKALTALCGAKTFLGKDDLDKALCPVSPTGCSVYPFTPDVLLSDGDEISLGNTTIRFVSTPGHTDGTMSMFFDVTDGERTLRAGMHGGVGLNTLSREYLTKAGEPFDHRDKYFASLERLKSEKVDIFIGNHVGNNDTEGKLARVHKGETDAFIDPEEWGRFLEKCRANLEKLISDEQEQQ